MKLTFYGRLRDLMETHQMESCHPATVGDSESLRRWIGQDRPELLDPSIRIVLDDVLVTGATPIAGVREVAFLPPASGG